MLGDAQFLPIFQPNQFNADYLDTSAQFDLGLSYLFERGKKRQHRLQAAKDQHGGDALAGGRQRAQPYVQVAQQFINVELAESTLELAQEDLKSFQNTVDISEERYKAGDISEDDLLKIKLQLLQFQTDVSQAQLARVQGLSDLRQLLGYESVPADYDVAGSFDYKPLQRQRSKIFKRRRCRTGPTCAPREQGVTAANSQYELQKAIGKRDVTAQINYTHIADLNTASLFGQIQLPIFDRNQGEIARTRYAIDQAQEQEKFTNGQVLTDVRDAYENLHTNDEIVTLYRSGISGRGAAGPRHQRIRLPARRREPAGFSRRRAQLPGHAACLPAGAGFLSARARTASRSRGNEEPAMRALRKRTDADAKV